jgi:poly-D-alanine transfer protein DltD
MVFPSVMIVAAFVSVPTSWFHNNQAERSSDVAIAAASTKPSCAQDEMLSDGFHWRNQSFKKKLLGYYKPIN